MSMKRISVIIWLITITIHCAVLFSMIPDEKVEEIVKEKPKSIKVALKKVIPPKPVITQPVKPKAKQKITKKKVAKKMITKKTIITEDPVDTDTLSVPEPEMVQVTETITEDVVYSDTLISVSDEEFLASILHEYKLKLRRLIASKRFYPKKAKRLNQTGTVKVEFNISKDGTILSSNIVEKSKFKTLNKAALKTIQTLAKVEEIPAELHCDAKSFIIPIIYSLK